MLGIYLVVSQCWGSKESVSAVGYSWGAEGQCWDDGGQTIPGNVLGVQEKREHECCFCLVYF